MNKWLWLLLIIIFWICAGFLIFGTSDNSVQTADAATGQPQRIVSMAPNLTEILFSLGLDEEIVGVTLYSNYPPAAAMKPRIGTFWQPNLEAVIAADPDLVVTVGFPQQKDAAVRLQRIGYKCLTVDLEKVPELYDAIGKIGQAANRERRAEELIEEIQGKIKGISDLIGNRTKPKVLWVVQRQPLMVAGRDTFINEMIELAGGENAIGPTINKYPPIGKELVIARSPDVIIEASMRPDNLQQQQQTAREYWRGLDIPTIQVNRIYVIDGDNVSRLGPRLYEGIETIARCLEPELFE
ncbi:MAG: ABC transporter substrate-binding protein [Planctomycetota bacterium]|jgi:iron complex transport system substrate-binding protein